MRHVLAQLLRLCLQKLEEGSDTRDIVTQVQERWDHTRPKKNHWRTAGRVEHTQIAKWKR